MFQANFLLRSATLATRAATACAATRCSNLPKTTHCCKSDVERRRFACVFLSNAGLKCRDLCGLKLTEPVGAIFK